MVKDRFETLVDQQRTLIDAPLVAQRHCLRGYLLVLSPLWINIDADDEDDADHLLLYKTDQKG